MKIIIGSLNKSLKLLLTNKIILLFSMAPVLIGIILYYFMGAWLFNDVLERGKEFITGYISSDGLGNILYWFMAAGFSVILFFIVNYTFVLLVSLISSPFNDLISARVEKLIRGKETNHLSESFRLLFKRLRKTLFNEIKKITVIGALTLISLSLSFFPLFAPLSLIITCLLLATSFLDYNWSRHDLSFRLCLKDIKSSFFIYGASGGIFMLLFSIPIINILFLPLAVIYFTVLFSAKNSDDLVEK